MDGWIKLHRCLIEKAIWKKSLPEQKVVLVTILCLANHEPNEWIWQGEKYSVQSGQFITSLEKLAEKSGVSIKSVRTALTKFEKLEFLANISAKTGRLITVTNWALYQHIEKKPADKSANDGQTGGKQVATNKNDNTVIMKEQGYVQWFDEFYKQYPKKKSKADAEKAWRSLKPDKELFNNIISAIGVQKKSREWLKDGGQFIPLPATWIRGRRWEDAQRVDIEDESDPNSEYQKKLARQIEESMRITHEIPGI